MGMAADEVSQAKAAQAAGQQQMIGGITDTLGSVSGALTGQFGEGLQGKLSGLIAPPKTTG
jgi:ADP-ribosylglycohydrolase